MKSVMMIKALTQYRIELCDVYYFNCVIVVIMHATNLFDIKPR